MSDAQLRLIKAENQWRHACRKHAQSNTVTSLRAEQSAWDHYAEMCDELGQCLQPGCNVSTTDYAYCEDHRE